MTDVKRLLDEATPLPWRKNAVGHRSLRHAAGEVTRSIFAVPVDPEIRHSMTDLTYIETDDTGPRIATTGNGPKRDANARLIVHAVNHLPDYEAAVDALGYLIGTWEQGVTPDIEKCRVVLRRLRGDA